jgi:hypothetical protein
MEPILSIFRPVFNSSSNFCVGLDAFFAHAGLGVPIISCGGSANGNGFSELCDCQLGSKEPSQILAVTQLFALLEFSPIKGSIHTPQSVPCAGWMM